MARAVGPIGVGANKWLLELSLQMQRFRAIYSPLLHRANISFLRTAVVRNPLLTFVIANLPSDRKAIFGILLLLSLSFGGASCRSQLRAQESTTRRSALLNSSRPIEQLIHGQITPRQTSILIEKSKYRLT